MVAPPFLLKRKQAYELRSKSMSAYECIKDILNLYIDKPYLKEVDSMSLRCTIFDLDNAFQRFFKA